MPREQKVLDRHLQHWRDKGLITAEDEARLREASAEVPRRGANRIVRAALGVLGGGLLLTGLILIVAENWDAIPRFGKLGAWATLQCAFLCLAHTLGQRYKDRPYLAETFAFVAGAWVLAGIALVSQIYHLDSRPANGVWLWLALVLPATWVLARRATSVVVFIALATAFALEAGTDGSWLYAQHAASPWLFLGIPVLAAALVSWLPHPARSIREWVGAWVFVVANFFMLVFGAVQKLDRTTLGGAWLVVGTAIIMALALPRRALPSAWDGLTSRLVLAIALLPWVLIGSAYDEGAVIDTLAVGLTWFLQLALAVLVIRSAARAGSTTWVNLGYLAVLAGVLTRYFDFFGDYLDGGIALALTGMLLLFILYVLEKARRRTLAKEVAA